MIAGKLLSNLILFTPSQCQVSYTRIPVKEDAGILFVFTFAVWQTRHESVLPERIAQAGKNQLI